MSPGIVGVVATLVFFAVPMRGQTTQMLPSVTTIAGSHTAGDTGDGGAATSATLSATVNSATMDVYGNLYIADTGNKVIRRVDAATGLISVYAGGGILCSSATDASGDGCPATQAIFVTPANVRWFRGDLYVVDSGDNRVRKISGSTGVITTVLGTGLSGTVTYGLAGPQTIVKAPQGLAFNSRGDMFVTQNGGAPRVDRVDAVTGLVNSFAGTGTGGKTGDGGKSSAATVNVPIGLAVDSHDNVYIAERANDDVRKVTVISPADITGTISTYAGPQATTVIAGYAGDGMTADNALFAKSGVNFIAFDGNDNLYIVDGINYRIRMVAPPAQGQNFGVITTVVGNGTNSDMTGADGQYAQNAVLVLPNDVQVTAAGDLVLTDTGLASVRMARPVSAFGTVALGAASVPQTAWALSSTAGTFSIVGSNEFSVSATNCGTSTVLTGTVCSAGVTAMPTHSGSRGGGLVFTDGGGGAARTGLSTIGVGPAASVLPGTIRLVAGSAAGTAGNSGDGAAASAALLRGPSSIAADSIGNLYIADSANDEVRRIAASSGAITSFAGTAGTAGYSGDKGAASSATLNAPASVAVDGAGNVYIADTGNNVVRRVDAGTGVISTVAGNGIAAYAGDGGPGVNAELSGPQGLAIAAGILYIADTGNHAVRALGLRSGQIQRIAGTGTQGSGGDGGQALAALLNSPAALAVDSKGTLYIADGADERIRSVDTAGIMHTIAGAGISGFNGDGSAATALLNMPVGIAVDAAGIVYLADSGNNRVRAIANGQIFTVAGGSSAGLGGNGGNSSSALLSAPLAVMLDAANNLYIADTGNNEVREINIASSVLAFPGTSPGTSSASLMVSLFNSGNATLAVSSVALPTGFIEDASGGVDCNTASLSVVPSGSCTLLVHFAPSSAGVYSANSTITDNAQAIAGTRQTVMLTGTAKSTFSFSFTLPGTVAAGAAQSVSVTVTNPFVTYAGTVHFSSSDKAAHLPSDYTYLASENGMHTFNGVTFGTTGIQSLTVADTTDPMQASTQTTTVIAGAPAAVQTLSGGGQSAALGATFISPLVARVVDAFGNPVKGVAVTFTAPASGPHLSFNGTSGTLTVTSDVNGLATTGTTTLIADYIVGSYSVAASAPGLSSASFTMKNTSSVAADFSLVPSTPAIATVLPGAAATDSLTLTPVGGFYASISLTCLSPEPTLTCSIAPNSLPASDGAAQVAVLTIQTIGPNRTGQSELSWMATLLLLMLGGFGFRRRKLRWLAAVMIACGMSLVLSGCGNTLYSGQKTPQGIYNVTVTASSGSATHTLTIPVAVSGD
ncbi:MAG: hypothetical protein V4555_15270 [Acidobacteriota bacterium]